MRAWRALLVSACLLAGLRPGGADAQVSRMEIHTFASTTLTDREFLTGKEDGRPVIVAGELRIPRAGGDRLPAVVLLHGSGGVVGNVDDEDVADKPIRVFSGAADDHVPVGPCRDYVGRLRKAGKDVQPTEYPGAYHVFDWSAVKSPVWLAQAQTARHCRTEEMANGVVVDRETRQPFTYNDPCVERGATIAYDGQAHAEAQKAVRDLARTVLQVK